MKSYSQVGQDLFVLSLFPEGYKGFFMDIGCQKPEYLNNTYLLEQMEWRGASFDIVDYSEQWKIRNTPFYCKDALETDFTKLDIPPVVDYLSLDISMYEGISYVMMKRLLKFFPFDFKVITIEHNSWLGYDLTERDPQRRLLIDYGYLLLHSDVADGGNKFEDWWVNPKYFDINVRAKI